MGLTGVGSIPDLVPGLLSAERLQLRHPWGKDMRQIVAVTCAKWRM